MKTSVILSNAFSLNMLSGSANIQIKEIGPEKASRILRSVDEIHNCIGHADTDAVVLNLLREAWPKYGPEFSVPTGQRQTVQLVEGTPMIVGQYSGPRLPEGATALPEGAEIKWFLVQLIGQEIKTIKESAVFDDENATEFDVGGWPISGPILLATEEVGWWGPEGAQWFHGGMTYIY